MKKENAINFLLFGYFGITLENSKDDIISAAINRAYRDAASHVLSLKDDSKKDTENGKKLFADACDCIEKFIEAVLPNEAQNEIDYDNKHSTLCTDLKILYDNCANSRYEFSYGVAQKWVNMTMKYLGIILTIFAECKDKNDFVIFHESFQAIEHSLHVPIDGYILEYVSKEKRTLSLDDYGNFEKVGDLGITLPRNDETITTKEGDLILYLGNKLCLYYNQNTWDFTKLGHIKDTIHLKEVLGKGNVQVTLLMK